MKVNCLSCGHNIELDEAYGDGYEGEIKCFGCEARLEIRTEQSALRSVRLLAQLLPDTAHSRAARVHRTAHDGTQPGAGQRTRHAQASNAGGSQHAAAHGRSV